jgi:hypothetical protein
VPVEQGLEVVVGGLELADELAVFREHGRPFLGLKDSPGGTAPRRGGMHARG